MGAVNASALIDLGVEYITLSFGISMSVQVKVVLSLRLSKGVAFNASVDSKILLQNLLPQFSGAGKYLTPYIKEAQSTSSDILVSYFMLSFNSTSYFNCLYFYFSHSMGKSSSFKEALLSPTSLSSNPISSENVMNASGSPKVPADPFGRGVSLLDPFVPQFAPANVVLDELLQVK